MNCADMGWNGDGLPKVFNEGRKVENIQVSGKGTIEVYISPEQDSAEASPDQSLRLLSVESDGFPIGYPEVLSNGETYAFSYVYTGTGEFSCISAEACQEFEPVTDMPGEALPVVQCLTLVGALYRSFTELVEFNREMQQFINCTSAFYWYLKETYSIERNPKTEMLARGIDYYRELKGNGSCFSDFSPDNFDECLGKITPETNGEYDLHTGKYISALMNIREDLRDSFFGQHSELQSYHLIESGRELMRIREFFKKEIGCSKKLFYLIFSNAEESIISELLRALVEIRQGNNNTADLLDFIDFICERFKGYITSFEEKYGYSIELNLNKLNLLLSNLKPGDGNSAVKTVSVQDNALQKLDGSLDRILEFSCIDTEKKDFFRNFVDHFKEAKPRVEHIPTEIKRKVNAVFFEIYDAVASRLLVEDPNCPAIDMFLLYGFIDSAFLTPQQVDGLYGLMKQFASEPNVHTMKSWLTRIGEGRIAPSVNELGVTYAQIIKEMKHGGKSEQPGDTIHFEVMNMLRTGHRVSSSQTSSYLAFLRNDMLPDDIGRFASTSKKIGDALRGILDIDYSAFHRELFYSGENDILKKEIVMKQVIPDIILLPVVGTRAMMWQELSSVSRSSPARWIIPILTSEDITSMLIKLTGQFRWELCRTIMGARWNDITYNSLTSVYSDYIESYKKNKNLTPEAKERLRSQLKRYQNNLRNIFTADYEMWLKYEYQGIRKLNREARGIFYRFCPFPVQKRRELINQPAFSDIATRFEHERMKIIREIESRYAYYVKRKCVLEEELVENLRFYKEM